MLPVFNTLTSHEIVIDLSRPAMQVVLTATEYAMTRLYWGPENQEAYGELANFRNLLQNLIDRSEPVAGNLDLVGG
jgi:hypothetical protein